MDSNPTAPKSRPGLGGHQATLQKEVCQHRSLELGVPRKALVTAELPAGFPEGSTRGVPASRKRTALQPSAQGWEDV